MKTACNIVVVCLVASSLLGCAAKFNSVQVKQEFFAAEKCHTVSVVYSKTFFQERFMGKSIGTMLLFGPLIGSAMWQGIGNFEGRNALRLDSSEYEKLLGDFDVSDHFIKQFSRDIHKSRLMNIALTDDSDVAGKVIKAAQSEKPEAEEAFRDISGRGYKCLAAFKVSYGLGARQGGEQFGFAKSYRPFIRVIGTVKNAASGEIVWANSLISFGSKRYVGGDANADKIDAEELRSAFRDLTRELIGLTFADMNGEEVPAMPVMVDTTQSDLQF